MLEALVSEPDFERLTVGPTADCTQAGILIEGLSAEHLLSDRGYDSDAIVQHAS